LKVARNRSGSSRQPAGSSMGVGTVRVSSRPISVK
jgi:hypothetical protein